MLKRILIATLSLSLIATSIPSYAKFGGSSSHSSFGSSRSSSYSSPSRSYSTPSAPRQTYAAPAQTSRPSSFGNGGNVGMQRSAVTNTVRPQTPAGSPPVPPRNNTYSSAGGGGYNGNNGGNTINHNYGNNGGGNNGGGGFGMGSLAMAAFGGYMLNGALHNRDGSMYSGQGYNNGAPIPGGQYAPPAGYVPQPVAEGGQAQYAQQQYVPVEKGTSWFWIFVQLLLVGLCIGVLVWIVRRVFINKDNSPVDLTMFQKAETKLQNNKETFFINFQKSNKPSNIDYIKANTVDYFFEAIQDDVLAGNDAARVVIKAIEAEVIDITDEGSKQVGSVHYQASISTDGNVEEINEVWHFVYAGGVWKLAGIEQV